MDAQEAHTIMPYALGRLFRIMSRPFKEGDIETFEDCRRAIMEAGEVLEIDSRTASIGSNRPGWNFGNTSVD